MCLIRKEKRMTKPTYQDADILLKMARLGIDMNVGEITGWVYSDEFVVDYGEFTKKYSSDSEEANKVRSILIWYETLGTLYKNGLFNEELLFDWLAVAPMWKRLESIALGQRKQSGNPRMFENFEALVNAEPK
jgi:hypothetical protein